MSILDFTTEPTIISRLYHLSLKIHRIINNFPKQEKYGLGKRIESGLSDCLSSVCLAAHEQKGFKTRPLLVSLAHADLANILIRMAHDLQLITTAQYHSLGTELSEITAMLGGWLRSSRTQ